MLHVLRRHPLAIQAHFDWVLVLTYALPESVLRSRLTPGLGLDTFQGCGFLAIALVQTRALRPAGLPAALGQDFFLSGYRIFTRLSVDGRSLRGLQILRSDTDRRRMALLGNLLTHYGYRLARVRVEREPASLHVRVSTPAREADLDVSAALGPDPVAPPVGSPFGSWEEARRFAGPLPHTFSYEPETRSIVVVRGLRPSWQPRPVHVEVKETTYWCGKNEPILASAFYLGDIDYRWERGWRVRV